jgi:hypothetical protein
MKKITCVLAILAAASTAAMAKDLKQEQKTAPVPTVAATQMSDAEMDKVTAGAAVSPTGEGLATAILGAGSQAQTGLDNPGTGPSGAAFINGGLGQQGNIPGGAVGEGRITAGH